ncbi:glycosyltransferase family 1 protein [Baudoinia panamericana UAMH 10762]|uniref:Glycosyltransferase family 1 protein n=1 Tax=Baudoinia panamericana (strain UAMH 10762) TaxID=717646 RepID=M2NHY8_BAUPA|nr:glycosyltransferase family 1 protein [Baudoinia panamericana UAMH 10762]EMC98969.1 glycosyltransferase family 1 protein [Baudoinia panamericana UAMH 10762]
MASGDEDGKKAGKDPSVPQIMVEQAGAAVTSEDANTKGRDLPTASGEGAASDNETSAPPPPAYGGHYGEVQSEQDGFGTKAQVTDDGRVDIRIKQSGRKLSSLLQPALRRQQDQTEKEPTPPAPYIPESLGGDGEKLPPPPMNVVIQVVGSRGDVQPFIALGKVLKDTYGHRVRLATHPNFKEFVREHGLEFFSIGGDPAQLMAFMVKNPGLMPSFDALRAGDVGKRRKEVGEYLKGCWRSCFEAGDGLGPEATNETIEDWTASHPTDSDAEPGNRPFVADCIVANPPSFAHIHCAEKMGLPLHIMFTMPYSPTQAFPHPLANIQSSNADPNLTNYITYTLIEMLTWQGLGDVINRFRQNSLGLEPISLVWAPGMLQRLQIPHTYCWSPALIPKPKDWGQNIAISGFFFLNLASNYTPAPDLKAFLDAGPPPVYIGFGSIVLDDPNEMTKLLFDAVRITGQRALISKGWGGMGADELGKPDGVFMLGNVPHDWLFKHVSCVVHHGGAGTTAAGITAGRPTVVVPFFGDQPFWGSMVARAGAGPQPIPHKQLTAENLAEAIEYCLRPESQQRAQELADKIASERGSDIGAQSFHQFLDVDKLRCNVSPSRAAVWRLKRTQVRLSAMAACTLANEGLLDFNDIKLYRPREYETDDGPWDPISGGATAIVSTMSTMMMGVADMPIDTLKALHIHPDTAKKRNASTSQSGAVSGSGSDTAVTSGMTTPTSDRSNSAFNLQESLAKLQASSSRSSTDTGQLSPPIRGSIPASMADALRGQLASSTRTRSRSGSRSRGASVSGNGGNNGESTVETVIDTSKGIRKIVGAGFSSPMDFTHSLATGFHNAPRLYGDDTVRKREQITDFKSGLKAATKEFGYGMFDGITGLVTQPMRGAAKEGPAGFFKGIGKGIGGIALKPGAAIFGIPGYTMKGVYKEMQKIWGSSVQNYIIAARTAQGYEEWTASTEEERGSIVRRWQELIKTVKKKRNPDEIVAAILEDQRRKKHELMDRLREKADHLPNVTGRSRASSASRAFEKSDDYPGATHGDPESAMLRMGAQEASLQHARTSEGPSVLEEGELREAIRLSVQETSRGNADEDADIEKAIQASLDDMQRERSMRADADKQYDKHPRQAGKALAVETTEHSQSTTLHDDELERAIAESLKVQRQKREDDEAKEGEPSADPPSYTASQSSVSPKANESALQQHAMGGKEKTQQEKTEEEIVMEYVKKQSLLEQHRRKYGSDDFGDADLERAMKASMDTT